ncbi:MAG: PAS domain S-box protein [Campylobacterota bacterium]|nr:PAS domain S-box protein [Campylobacterota bacterium]
MIKEQIKSSTYRRESDKVIKSLQLIDKYIIRSVADLDGIIIDASQAFCDIAGYTKKELIGKYHSIVKHPDTSIELFKDMWNTIKSGKVWSGELQNLKKDGTGYWVDVKIEPNFDENNNIVSYTAIRHVISDKIELEKLNNSLEERVKAETKKNIQQLDLMQQERLENIKLNTIGTLAAGMTHEINTPLTYIKGNFEMMRYDIEDLPNSDLKIRMIEDSKRITDGINRLGNIVESMREMSQKSKEIREDTNIYQTIVTALTLLCNRAKQISNIKFNGEDFVIGFDKNKEQFISYVQKQRVEQVWVIIINNALDELVKIGSFEDRLIDINIKYSEDKQYIITQIRDNAGGISNNIIDKIFDPFTSSKESSGMGIGLNIAKKIIDEQDGQLLAYNENGSAVFEVRLRCGECSIK